MALIKVAVMGSRKEKISCAEQVCIVFRPLSPPPSPEGRKACVQAVQGLNLQFTFSFLLSNVSI